MIGNPFEPIGGGTEPAVPGGAMIGNPFGPMLGPPADGGGTGRGGRLPPPPQYP
jgi:hypothetical protein